MARLIDEIRNLGSLKQFEPDRWLPEEDRKKIPRAFTAICDHSLPVMVIDNVAEYFRSFAARGEFKWGPDWSFEKAFPTIAPPYRRFWLEHRGSSVVVDWNSKPAPDAPNGQMFEHQIPDFRSGVLVTQVAWEEPDPAIRWTLRCELFNYVGPYYEPPGKYRAVVLDLNEEGALTLMTLLADNSMTKQDLYPNYSTTIMALYPALLAICFMHCKNVKVLDNKVPKPLAKKWHAKHNLWPSPYKTLMIEPMTEILRREGNSESTGLTMALHICRGHWRNYREGKGLFGKYHGMYWQPSVVRGTKRYDLDEGDTPPREIAIKLPEPEPEE